MKNKPIKVKWLAKDHKAWEEQRKDIEGVGKPYTRVGASDVACILNDSKWKSKRRLFLHLVGEHSQFQMSETTVAGHILEPTIVSRWESWDADEDVFLKNLMSNTKLRKTKKADFFVLNEAYPNFFVSLDYIPKGVNYSPFTGEKYESLTPIELKHTNSNYYRMWNDGITSAYYAQVQTQMMLTNTNVAVFNVLIDGVKYKVREVYRDEAKILEIQDAVNDFVDLVNRGKIAYYKWLLADEGDNKELLRLAYEELIPPYSGTDDDVQLADELWQPIDNDITLLLGDEDDDSLMEDYTRYLELEATIKSDKQRIMATLKDRCKDGFEGIKTENFKCINRPANHPKGRYFSIKKLK